MTYSSSRRGSKKSYFRQLPNLDYPSLANDRTSAYDYNQVKNIFRRAVLRDDVFDSYVQFEKYSVEGDDRPDNVASKIYGDPALDWVVLTTNNIIHIRDEWPMSQGDLNNYLANKYSSQELSYIHHYETLKILDSFGNLIQPEGIEVQEGYSVTFVDRGVSKTESRLKSFTYLEHEIDVNDKKREIDVLLPEYVEIFLRDIGNIMEYKPSRQFVNEKLKKTENPRIISP
mgnify:FL=1|jgi:hypothetical protein|tara:strand:+ start:123 stop:809 length:687 start_codon:yes stop_codon:yes gene_type:complete